MIIPPVVIPRSRRVVGDPVMRPRRIPDSEFWRPNLVLAAGTAALSSALGVLALLGSRRHSRRFPADTTAVGLAIVTVGFVAAVAFPSTGGGAGGPVPMDAFAPLGLGGALAAVLGVCAALGSARLPGLSNCRPAERVGATPEAGS